MISSSKTWLRAARATRSLLAITVLGAFGLLAPGQASAQWAGAVTGAIGTIEVTHGANFALRIWLSGVGAHCTGGTGWAYVDEADSNYKVFVSALLMAKASGKTVTLFTVAEPAGFCRIGHMALY